MSTTYVTTGPKIDHTNWTIGHRAVTGSGMIGNYMFSATIWHDGQYVTITDPDTGAVMMTPGFKGKWEDQPKTRRLYLDRIAAAAAPYTGRI